MTKIYAEHLNSVSWGGKEYRKAKDGSFDVPAEALEDLLPHGITTEAPKVSKPSAPAGDDDKAGDEATVKAELLKELHGLKNKDEVAAYALEHFKLELDPKEMKRDDMEAAILAKAAEVPQEQKPEE